MMPQRRWTREATLAGLLLATIGVTAIGADTLRAPISDGTSVGPGTPVVGSVRRPDTVRVVLAGESRLWIEGGSTVRSFNCEVGTVAAEVRAESSRTPLRVERLSGAVTDVRVEIPVGDLDCSNDTMNDHMWRALQRERHSTIRFRLQDYVVEARAADSALVDMAGELTMAGQTQPLTVTARASETPEGALRLEGSTGLDMTRYGVEPPSLFFGTMRVDDQVTVHFDLFLRSGSADR